jgi:hypothetical protein
VPAVVVVAIDVDRRRTGHDRSADADADADLHETTGAPTTACMPTPGATATISP